MQGLDFNAAIAHAKKNGWINIEKTDTGSKISLQQEKFTSDGKPIKDYDEYTIKNIAEEKRSLGYLDGDMRRSLPSLMDRPDYIIEHKEKTKTVSLSETGKHIDLEKLDSGAIDVEADVPHVHAARIHLSLIHISEPTRPY